jgi:hypothetical protein
VAQSLAAPEAWHEYSMTLAFTALRAMTWTTMPIASRRLMYLVSALAMSHFNQRDKGQGEDGTPSPEEKTDIFKDN